MNALSLQTRYQAFATGFNVLLLAGIVINIAMYGFHWLPFVVLILGFALAAWMHLMTRHSFAPLAKLTAIRKHVYALQQNPPAPVIDANAVVEIFKAPETKNILAEIRNLRK